MAIEGVAVFRGDGLGQVESYGISLLARQWDHRPDGDGWNLRIHWEISLARWLARDADTGVDTLWDASVTPVLRLLPTRRPAPWPYVEVGLGAHVLTEDKIEDRTLSTPYHFGSHAGIGVLFGAGHGLDVSLRYQHLSNASIETPNPGIDFAQARIAFTF